MCGEKKGRRSGETRVSAGNSTSRARCDADACCAVGDLTPDPHFTHFINMSQLLLSELTSLSSETRRKHPEVRAAADAALAALKADQAQALRLAADASGPAQENLLLKPILLACTGKTAPKVASIAVGLMQRVVGMKVVPEVSGLCCVCGCCCC